MPNMSSMRRTWISGTGYAHRACTRRRHGIYEYCIKHILEDKNSPYKQCSFVCTRSGRRCTGPAPKPSQGAAIDSFVYCMDHASTGAHQHKTRNFTERHRTNLDSLLSTLDQHHKSKSSTVTSFEKADTADQSGLPLDGYKKINLRIASMTEAVKPGRTNLEEDEYSSDSIVSDSDDMAPLGGTAGGAECGLDSDTESVDSEQEDLLKHAAVYTAEEVALIFRDKLIRLQSLYIDQFKRLHHVLKEKRRDYLTACGATTITGAQVVEAPLTRGRASRLHKGPNFEVGHAVNATAQDKPLMHHYSQISGIHVDSAGGVLADGTCDRSAGAYDVNESSAYDTEQECVARPSHIAERRMCDELTALKHYQKRYGSEALLQRQCRRRRVEFSEGLNQKSTQPSSAVVHSSSDPVTCGFISADCNEICTMPALPLSTHCLDHIVHDPRQVLYTLCNYTSADALQRCSHAVINTMQTCDLHSELQPVACRYNRRDTDSRSEDNKVEVDVVTFETKTSDWTKSIKNSMDDVPDIDIQKMENSLDLNVQDNGPNCERVKDESKLEGNAFETSIDSQTAPTLLQ